MQTLLDIAPELGLGAAALAAITIAAVRIRASKPRNLSLDAVTPAGLDVPSRLSTARAAFGNKISTILRGGPSDEKWRELEELLISTDLGLATTNELVSKVRQSKISDAGEAIDAIKVELRAVLGTRDRSLKLDRNPSVILVVGVNGVGKTTTIAKIAARVSEKGATPVMAAADTYRAAADKQLAVWADRVGVEVVSGEQGADPASIAYQGVARAKEASYDTVIVDTAGRLHSKKNLMDELHKIVRVLEKEAGSIDEALLVIDGTAGQNGLAQARAFSEAVDLTGVVLTKMDGSAKGGIAFAVEKELDIPVKFIGLGEGVDDLIAFDPDAYVEALLS